MKKIIIAQLLLLLVLGTHAQTISYARYIDGYWSEWELVQGCIHGSYGEILCYDCNHHPSEFTWRLTLNNFIKPSKELIKDYYKKKCWWEYQGYFEYYISDEYQTLKSQLLNRVWITPWLHDVSKGQTPCVKRTVRATVKIAPYKDHPRCYNVYVEGDGFGIDLRNIQLRF